jgi:tetratricopeptide (TPR) repeat protein
MPKTPDIDRLPLWQKLIPPCILSVITLWAYWPSLHYNFQFDDVANIQKHFYIRHHSLWSLWFSGSRWISYWLNAIHYSIGKFDTFSYRLGNVCIHMINGMLVFFVLLTALLHSKNSPFFKKNAFGITFATATLFLLHPVQTQTVSYVCQGQLEGLACMAILGMILTFLNMQFTVSHIRKYALGALLFVIAVFSCFTKEIAIISPALLILADWFFVAQGCPRSLSRRLLLHAALFILIVGIYMWFLKPAFFTNILGFSIEAKNNVGNIITQSPEEVIRPWPFFISQFKVILHYLQIFVWPFNISVEYDWVLCRSFFSLDCILPLISLIAIGLAVMRLLYTHCTHILAFGALWFFICIAPRSSIIPSPELLVDYKTYTASIGWLLILACGIIQILNTCIALNRRLSGAKSAHYTHVLLSAVLIVPLYFMTTARNEVWSSGTKFWMNVIENAPGKARAYNNYGAELAQVHNRYEEAIAYFNKAARMNNRYSDPLNNASVCYSHLNRTDKAIETLMKSLHINPQQPESHNNLASLYLQQKNLIEAEKHLHIALQMRPHYGKAYINLGRLYADKNDQKKSLEYFKKACTIADLDNAYGFKVYAQIALAAKEFTQAIWAFEKTLTCDPHDTDALFNLAYSYYQTQQTDKAKKIYTSLLATNASDIRIHFNLGEVYLMEENYCEALKCFKQIEAHSTKLPQVHIRLAHCYEKMGNLDAARNELQILAHNSRADNRLRSNAEQLLIQLHAHYAESISESPIIV